MSTNNFETLGDYITKINDLTSSLYDDKVDVNNVKENELSTHVTASDLNIIKQTLSTLLSNINLINKHLISAEIKEESNTVKTNLNQELNRYLANDYLRKNQIIVNGTPANDSVIYLDDTYLRSKNIFVDGYKISPSSPYNLVSWNLFNNRIRNIIVGDLQVNNTLNAGAHILIDENNHIHCTLKGDNTITDISNDNIIIKPAGDDVTKVMKSVSGIVQWGDNEDDDTHYTTRIFAGTGNAVNATTTNGNTKITIADDDIARNSITLKGGTNVDIASDDNGIITISALTGSTYSAGEGLSLDPTTHEFKISAAAANVNKVLRSNNGVILWGDVGATSLSTQIYAGSGITKDNNAAENGEVKLKLFDDDTARNAIILSGANAIKVTSDDNGIISFDVDEGTAENKGIVQLVNEITEENKNSIDLALTPSALKSFSLISEHILKDISGTIIDNNNSLSAINGKLSSDTGGWIRLSSMKSNTYPGCCLAFAWGTTDLYYYPNDSQFNLILNLEIPNYCRFYHIIYPVFNIIPVSSAAGTAAYTLLGDTTSVPSNVLETSIDWDIQFKKFVAEALPPVQVINEETGDVEERNEKVVNKIHAYLQTFNDKKATFYIKWFLLGYINAYIDEVWSTNNSSDPTIEVTTSPSLKNTPVISEDKDFSGWFNEPDLVHSNYKATVANGDVTYCSSAGGAGVEREVLAKWTINRVEDEVFGKKYGIYHISNLKTCVYSRTKSGSNVKTFGKFYVDFSNAKINFLNGKITDVIVHRHGDTQTVKNTLWFDPKRRNQQLLYADEDLTIPAMAINKDSYFESVSSNPSTNRSRLFFNIKVSAFSAEITIRANAWFQKDGTSYAEIWHSPINDATITFIEQPINQG